MGLIKKLTSVSTGGAINYRSVGENRTKAVKAQAKLAQAEAKPAKQQVQDQAEEKAAEHVQDHLDGSYPAWRLTGRERILLRRACKEQAGDKAIAKAAFRLTPARPPLAGSSRSPH